VAMTAPVLMETSKGYVMTSPVLIDKTADSMHMSFVLPSEYTLETLPKPLNDEVKIEEIPEHTMAVLEYSWFLSDKSADENEAKLREFCERDGVKVFQIFLMRSWSRWGEQLLATILRGVFLGSERMKL
jgi:hypothetical protein